MLLGLLTATANLSAQNIGFALGADRDTLKYIIASPFDNWFLNFSGGVQTFIGNTPDKQAAWNSCDYGIRAEIGKWIIPDMALSLRFGMATVHSQSRFGGNNPWSDISNPLVYDGAHYGPYYPIRATSFYAIGIVTFDWTNFLSGYESGKRKHWHIYTPVGLGGMIFFGDIVNPNYVNKVNNRHDEVHVELGDMARNKELAFTSGLMTEYYATKYISFNAALELAWARGSIDDYNYNLDMTDQRTIDLVPSFYVGAKINLLKNVNKVNPYTRTAQREKVNHEFLAFGSSHTVSDLRERIENLVEKIDSIQNLSDQLGPKDTLALSKLQDAIDSIQAQLDSVQNNNQRPQNIIEELLDINDVLNLPATIVYYQLDKYDIDYNGRKKLQIFAKEVNKLDDTIEYFIIGAADSLTGSRRHNDWLSDRRCEAAYNYLVKYCDASANQFVLVPVGGINVYDPKEYNRIALIIQRTPTTQTIVDRWMRYGW